MKYGIAVSYRGRNNKTFILLSDKNHLVFRKNAAAIYENSPLYFGKGTGYIDTSLYGLHCNGDENSLYDCPHYSEEPNPYHTHKHDVGVACSKWSERETHADRQRLYELINDTQFLE